MLNHVESLYVSLSHVQPPVISDQLLAESAHLGNLYDLLLHLFQAALPLPSGRRQLLSEWRVQLEMRRVGTTFWDTWSCSASEIGHVIWICIYRKKRSLACPSIANAELMFPRWDSRFRYWGMGQMHEVLLGRNLFSGFHPLPLHISSSIKSFQNKETQRLECGLKTSYRWLFPLHCDVTDQKSNRLVILREKNTSIGFTIHRFGNAWFAPLSFMMQRRNSQQTKFHGSYH